MVALDAIKPRCADCSENAIATVDGAEVCLTHYEARHAEKAKCNVDPALLRQPGESPLAYQERMSAWLRAERERLANRWIENDPRQAPS